MGVVAKGPGAILTDRDALIRELQGKRFDRVLEVGSGPCVWSEHFEQISQCILALHASPEMLQGCPAISAKVRRCCGDALDLPVRSGMFDALCCIRAFEYFPDKARAVAEFHRVLKREESSPSREDR